MKKVLTAVCAAVTLFGANLHFSLHKMESGKGDTLLIIGGIHGNEPGGYFAPSLFLSRYKIEHGNVWVVPNLNFDSIVANQRGVYGDMNRKFAVIKNDDKDKEIVADIKKIMTEPRVGLILNLHDGHGFYRPVAKNDLFNPKAWGQAFIIDQQSLAGAKYGNLAEIASKVTAKNKVVLQEDVHEFNVKNTETKDKDEAMRQSLTYFAIQNKKPALAVETSKNISDLPTKVLYQLKSFEEFMQIMGIKYKRDFELNIKTVSMLLKEHGEIEIPPLKIKLPLSELRPQINYFPVDQKGVAYKSQNPLVALVKNGGKYDIYNGNIKLSTLSPQGYKFDDSIREVDVNIDGKTQKAAFGSYAKVKSVVKIDVPSEYRLNIIGFSKAGVDNESGIEVSKNSFEKSYSLDKSAKLYRAEVYKGKNFCGMIVINFE